MRDPGPAPAGLFKLTWLGAAQPAFGKERFEPGGKRIIGGMQVGHGAVLAD